MAETEAVDSTKPKKEEVCPDCGSHEIRVFRNEYVDSRIVHKANMMPYIEKWRVKVELTRCPSCGYNNKDETEEKTEG